MQQKEEGGVVFLLSWTPTFEWYMARLVAQNEYREDTWHVEVGLCARNVITILGSIGD